MVGQAATASLAGAAQKPAPLKRDQAPRWRRPPAGAADVSPSPTSVGGTSSTAGDRHVAMITGPAGPMIIV